MADLKRAEARVVRTAMRWYHLWCITQECSRLARARITMPNGTEAALAIAALKLKRARKAKGSVKPYSHPDHTTAGKWKNGRPS